MLDYDLVNMSDSICFRAPDKQIATLVTILLGNGQYSAKAIGLDGNEIAENGDSGPGDAGSNDGKVTWPHSVPFFMFGGFDPFWKANWPDVPADEAIDRRKPEVIAALRTVMLGNVGDRRLYDGACAAITDPDKLKAFQADWNDKKRSSLNDIMGRALAIADKFEADKPLADVPSAPRQVFTRA